MRKLILTVMLSIGLSGATDGSQAEVKIIEHIRFPGNFVKDEMERGLNKETQKFLNTSNSDVQCLARNIYFESLGQGNKGMLAVGLVTVNRLESGKFGETICKVVNHKDTIKIGNRWKTICQFSWKCDGKSDIPSDKEEYAKCVVLARRVLTKTVPDITKNATHFHTKYVKPAWSKSYRLVAIIGDHKFYKPIKKAA
jgi:spore germination cell wall hydrolase CwlJ-like protein